MNFHTLVLTVASFLLSFSVASPTTTTSTPPAATGNAAFKAMAITSNNQTSLSNYTAEWTVSLSLYNSTPSDSNLTTNLSLSWPPGTGPTANSRATVNLVWIFGLVPHNFTGLDASADGSGNCSALLGSACAYDVGSEALTWGVTVMPGGPVFRIPESCESVHTGSKPSAGAALALNATNDTALFTSHDPTDSSNVSTVFDTARRRVWPVFVVEQVYAGDNTVGGTGFLVCPQALNLTGSTGLASVSTSTSVSSTSSSMIGGTSRSVGVATNATSKALGSSPVEKLRDIRILAFVGMMTAVLIGTPFGVIFW